MLTTDEFEAYIIENFPDITDRFIDHDHISGYCPNCKRDVAFTITDYRTATITSYRYATAQQVAVSDKPKTIMFRCPISGCGRFKIWVVEELILEVKDEEDEDAETEKEKHIFLLNSIPNDNEEIEGVPDEPSQLKAAYKEAVRCLNAGAPMAAAAMLRRALQIITRDILKAKPGKLANELQQLKGAANPLGIPLTQDFSDNAYIIKEAGNQGAHPDKDPDLLSFDAEDAEYLHEIFAKVVAEIFIAPAAAKKAREGFLKKRKIST